VAPLEGEWHDWACVIHVHSTFSDGTPTVHELVADAAVNDRDAVLLTDHDTVGARDAGLEGWHRSVLLVVGEEVTTAAGHLLAFGASGFEDRGGPPGREVTAAVARQGGVSIAAHPFSAGSAMSRRIGRPHPWREREDPNLTGLEVWSLLTDAAEDWSGLRDAARFLRSPRRRARSPRRRGLKAWDELGSRRRVVGVGGLDAHQSGFRLSRSRRPLSPMRNDLYFGSLATHVLTGSPPSGSAEADRAALLESLASGRAYLAMDWHHPGRGFRFWAEGASGAATMGEEVGAGGPWRLRATIPAPATIRLLRDGTVVHVAAAVTEFESAACAPGVYRIEAWRGELCWILSNPIYLREQGR
jgi:hypothetical protein